MESLGVYQEEIKESREKNHQLKLLLEKSEEEKN